MSYANQEYKDVFLSCLTCNNFKSVSDVIVARIKRTENTSAHVCILEGQKNCLPSINISLPFASVHGPLNFTNEFRLFRSFFLWNVSNYLTGIFAPFERRVRVCKALLKYLTRPKWLQLINRSTVSLNN